MALSNVLLSSRELIEKAFDMIDKDKDGATAENAKQMIEKIKHQ